MSDQPRPSDVPAPPPPLNPIPPGDGDDRLPGGGVDDSEGEE